MTDPSLPLVRPCQPARRDCPHPSTLWIFGGYAARVLAWLPDRGWLLAIVK